LNTFAGLVQSKKAADVTNAVTKKKPKPSKESSDSDSSDNEVFSFG